MGDYVCRLDCRWPGFLLQGPFDVPHQRNFYSDLRFVGLAARDTTVGPNALGELRMDDRRRPLLHRWNCAARPRQANSLRARRVALHGHARLSQPLLGDLFIAARIALSRSGSPLGSHLARLPENLLIPQMLHVATDDFDFVKAAVAVLLEKRNDPG